MYPQLLLIASVILGVILIPSLITVQPNPYSAAEDEFTKLARPGSQSTE